MKVLHVVGARPNFMKMAPVHRALGARDGIVQTVVHTGQHYDQAMSQVFFDQLGMPNPDVNLEVGSATHAQQTATIMSRLEGVLLERQPDMTLVYGDVNSTMAAAVVCSKMRLPIAHVEAGLRSGDRDMPEEINRVITDCVADLLFTPSEDGDANLLREGVSRERIHFVGNVMIDTLVRLLPAAQDAYPALRDRFHLEKFGLVTLHRPSNVDDPEGFSRIMDALLRISSDIPLLFPIHPRTRARLGALAQGRGQMIFCDPLSYIEFLALQKHATVVLTDSGGIQEETTFLGTPCLTLRENTERPVTVTFGTNVLVGRDMDLLDREVRKVLNGEAKRGSIPPLWDGHASERIAGILASV